MAMTRCPECGVLVIHSGTCDEVTAGLDRAGRPALIVDGVTIHHCRTVSKIAI